VFNDRPSLAPTPSGHVLFTAGVAPGTGIGNSLGSKTPIAMIAAPFRRPAVSGTGGRDLPLATGGATGPRAVRMAAIAGDTDRKDTMTATARLLAERNVPGSEQRAAPTGRTAQTVAQQAGRPRRVGARGRHEGPEVQSGPSPSVCSAYAIADRRTQRRGRGRCRVRGRTPRVHRRLEISPRTRDSHTAHRRHLCLEHDQDRNGSSTARPDFCASTWLATNTK